MGSSDPPLTFLKVEWLAVRQSLCIASKPHPFPLPFGKRPLKK